MRKTKTLKVLLLGLLALPMSAVGDSGGDSCWVDPAGEFTDKETCLLVAEDLYNDCRDCCGYLYEYACLTLHNTTDCYFWLQCKDYCSQKKNQLKQQCEQIGTM